ncbi:MAG: Calx-beta domain-containing protein [Bacteroidales bacterium]
MKKILTYLNTIILIALLLVSCNPNRYATFDDADAFVAFDAPNVKVNENAGFIEVSITLASVQGVNTTIKCIATDGKAISGKDYLLDGDGSLVFDSQNRTQKLKVKIINNPGRYTGDLDFTLTFVNTGTVNVGAASKCVVSILDLDHPLASILGDYTASGSNPEDGTSLSWTMTLRKDPTDVSKIWFYNIANLGSWAMDDIMYYGVVNKDLTTITIPVGQESKYAYSNGNHVALLSLNANGDDNDEGSITVKILENGKKFKFEEFGIMCNIAGAGWIGAVMPEITCAKK